MRRYLAIVTALVVGVTAIPFATRAQVDVIDNDAPTDYNQTPNTFSFDDMEPILESAIQAEKLSDFGRDQN